MIAPGPTGRSGDPYAGYDVRLDGDPGSARSAAARLRAECARWEASRAGDDPAAREVGDAARRLAAALDRFGEELRRAQRAHEAGPGDVQRNAALALAARARRRLRLACADIVPEPGLRFRP